ncbi:hypothetical protein SUDANB66_06503 (plasmid) [Streptomyces sp. SudanB66_2053]
MRRLLKGPPGALDRGPNRVGRIWRGCCLQAPCDGGWAPGCRRRCRRCPCAAGGPARWSAGAPGDRGWGRPQTLRPRTTAPPAATSDSCACTSPPRHRTNATSLASYTSVKLTNGSIHFGSPAEITPHMTSQRTNRHTGRNSLHCSGQEADSVAVWMVTTTWQLAHLPRAPQYCGATATDILPSLGNDASSIAQAVGVISSSIRSASRRCTGTGSHVDWFMNCCRFCSLPSGSLDAWLGSTCGGRPASVPAGSSRLWLANPCAAPTRTHQPHTTPTSSGHGSLHVRPSTKHAQEQAEPEAARECGCLAHRGQSHPWIGRTGSNHDGTLLGQQSLLLLAGLDIREEQEGRFPWVRTRLTHPNRWRAKQRAVPDATSVSR